MTTPPKDHVEGAFDGAIDTDTPLQAAAREAGWALSTLVDISDWQRRDQISDIIGRLAVALIDADTTPKAKTAGREAFAKALFWELENHDRCPPEARDAYRRHNTVRLIMHRLDEAFPTQAHTGGTEP